MFGEKRVLVCFMNIVYCGMGVQTYFQGRMRRAVGYR